MKHLDLFSGIGGFALAAQRVGWETVGFCEIDPFCQKVLHKHWPDVPIHRDIRELNGSYKSAQVITGGFPCQPFSTAARGRNNAEDMWPEMYRLICETRPNWVVAENVPGGRFKHIERACAGLARIGYTCWPFDVAVETRRHNRRRIWIVAHADSDRESDGPFDEKVALLQEATRFGDGFNAKTMGVDDGLPGRMDRLMSLGNSIIPQIAEVIFRAINAANGGNTDNILPPPSAQTAQPREEQQ